MTQEKNMNGNMLVMQIFIVLLMQPSMGTLNSSSLRVVKDSTPSRSPNLRCINFGIDESSPNFIFEHVAPNFYLNMFERTGVLLFSYFIYLKVNLDLEKQISLMNLRQTLFSRR